MSEWKPVSSFIKYNAKGITPRYVENSQIIVLNQKCIRDNKIDYSFSQFMDNSRKISKEKFVVQGDILINSTGAGTAGRCAFVAKLPQNHRLIVDSHILILRCTSYHEAECLSYVLHSFEKKLMSFMTGSSGQSELDKVILLNLLTKMPKNIETQKKITSVLSSLDAKIEINNRINAELEAMAKTLYDYWFVQFDFPDKNGKPYKSSGGKMVWNAELKREIPDGWDVLQLLDIITRSSTGLNPRDNFKLGTGDNFYVTIKNINNGKIVLDEKCDKVDDEALRIINQRSDLRLGDVLFTSIEPVGVTYLIQEKPKNWNINESVFTLRPNYERITSEYLFLLLSSEEMKAFTKNVSAGSIHKGVRHGILKTFNFPYGGLLLIDIFSKILNPILRKIDRHDKENKTLSSLRDWLLPMLMNGQVKVT